MSKELKEIALRERIRQLPSDACELAILEIISEAKTLPYPPCAMALEALALKLLEHLHDRRAH